MKNVVIISQSDLAGSAYQVCKAINSVGRFNVRAVTLQEHPFCFPSDIVIPCHCKSYDKRKASDFKDYDLLVRLLNEADIIHLFNDIPKDPKYMDFERSGVNIPMNKSTIVTMTGSLYRQEHQRLNQIIKSRGWKLVVQNPLLKFLDEINSVFIPDAVDTDFFDKTRIEKSTKKDKLVLGFYCGFSFDTSKKDLEILVRSVPENYILGDFTHRKNWDEYIRDIKECDVFYHGILISSRVGYIGRSDLEAMALGIPVVTSIDLDRCFDLSEGKLDVVPVVNCTQEDLLKDAFSLLSEEKKFIYGKNIREYTSDIAKKWVEKYFSYSVVGNLYSDAYEEVL